MELPGKSFMNGVNGLKFRKWKDLEETPKNPDSVYHRYQSASNDIRTLSRSYGSSRLDTQLSGQSNFPDSSTTEIHEKIFPLHLREVPFAVNITNDECKEPRNIAMEVRV